MKYNEYELPENLKYNKDSSWVKLEGDIATVGVIEPSAKKVTEFVFAQMPQKGPIKQGETYVTLEAVKWTGHLTSPVSGEIIEVNDAVYDEPSEINKDPYNAWIMKVKVTDKKEIDSLYKPEEIIEWLDAKLQ
ncbi:MAG: glycine cleavage system protein H [Candidatus Woesearchaeota archaeon]